MFSYLEKIAPVPLLKFLIVYLSIFVASPFFALADQHRLLQENINVAILPCSDVVKTYEQYQPLVSYLSAELAHETSLVVLKSVQELSGLLKQNKVQFVLHGPHSYIELAEFYSRQSLVKSLTPEGADTSSALIITRTDANIFRLEDLKGKSIELGRTTSGLKWLAARLLLKQAGIDINKDLSFYAQGGCCTDIILDVYFNKFDAGVICQHGLTEITDEKIDMSQLKVLAQTPPMHNIVFAANRSVSTALIKKTVDALLALDPQNPDHQKILHKAECGGFAKTTDDHYNSLRTKIKELGDL